MHNIFVYGTLMQTDIIEQVGNQPFLGVMRPAQVRECIVINTTPRFLMPYPGFAAEGLVIDSISDYQLERMDIYEQTAAGMYVRQMVTAVYRDGVSQWVWAYLAGPEYDADFRQQLNAIMLEQYGATAAPVQEGDS